LHGAPEILMGNFLISLSRFLVGCRDTPFPYHLLPAGDAPPAEAAVSVVE